MWPTWLDFGPDGVWPGGFGREMSCTPHVLHPNYLPDVVAKMFTVLLMTVLFVLVLPASSFIDIDELTTVQYDIDILDKPQLLDEVSNY
jgi:hypothetical protein